VGGFAPSANRSGGYEGPNIGLRRCPPKMSLQERQGAAHPRMTGETGRVTPLEDLGASRIGNKQAVRRAVTWVGLVFLGLLHQLLDLPGNSSHHAGGRYVVRVGWSLLGAVQAGEGIRVCIFGTGTVRDSEVEPPEEKGPPGLAGVEALGHKNLCGQIFVVSPYDKWKFRPLQPVSLQGQLHRQQLTIAHIGRG